MKRVNFVNYRYIKERMINQQKLLERITINPGIMAGKPVIRGLRFPVSNILELLASGLTSKEV